MREIDLIALAGFLHDIGKFGQRAVIEKFANLDDFEKSFAVCNRYKCSYQHASYTAKVLSDIKLDNIENLVNLASSHHKQNLNGLEKIIQEADWIASDERKVGESSDFINTNLLSIFSEVGLCNIPDEYYFLSQKFDRNLQYPINNQINEKNQTEYDDLYKAFINDFEKLELDFENYPFQSFLNLKSILEKYTTFIPSSSYKSYPDVSLFDHLLTTAAVATAKYLSEDKDRFYLIQGDFTSIQSFIFSKGGESNKYLAKILRAKSLFVSLVTEIIALKICKELNLTPLSILINAGGKFSILAPKSNKVKEVIEKVKEEINREFSKINFLQTKFIVDYYEEDFSNLAYKKASEVMENSAKKFEEAKLKFDSDIEVFDNYIEELKEKELCDICGIVPTNEKEEDIYICKFCKKFKELGEKFTKSKYMKLRLNYKELINSIDFGNEKNFEKDSVYYAMDEDEIWAIKRVANYVPLIENVDNSKYKLIEEKFDNLKKGDIKSFYHIAVDGLEEKEDGFYGRKYLAILKADVDNLGQIFINGFKRGEGNIPIKKVKNNNTYDEATFSRIVSLSRMMDFYFTTILKEKIKTKYKNIYTVFAGGDDLFLIGHYKYIIALHKELIKDFQEYVQNNDIHLSYAIRFTSANVPLHHMAEFAESDLEKAKDFNKNNSVIFGIKVSNKDILKLYELEEEFRKMNFLSESFLYKIYTFIDMKEAVEKSKILEEKIKNARWRALFNYYLQSSVSGEDKEKNIEKAVVIGDWIEEWGERLKIPLNLYLYSKRKYKKESK